MRARVVANNAVKDGANLPSTEEQTAQLDRLEDKHSTIPFPPGRPLLLFFFSYAFSPQEHISLQDLGQGRSE